MKGTKNDRNKKWTTILKTTKVNIINVEKKYSHPEIGDTHFSLNYELLNSNQPLKCEHVVEFLLFSYKRLCTVSFGIRNNFRTIKIKVVII